MQPDVIRLVDGIDDALVVLFVGHKVEAIGVEQQDTHVALLMVQKIEIALLDALQIRVADFLLIAAPALANVGLQPRHIGIEIYEQLRLGHVRKDDVEET